MVLHLGCTRSSAFGLKGSRVLKALSLLGESDHSMLHLWSGGQYIHFWIYKASGQCRTEWKATLYGPDCLKLSSTPIFWQQFCTWDQWWPQIMECGHLTTWLVDGETAGVRKDLPPSVQNWKKIVLWSRVTELERLPGRGKWLFLILEEADRAHNPRWKLIQHSQRNKRKFWICY